MMIIIATSSSLTLEREMKYRALFCFDLIHNVNTPGALGDWFYPNGSAVGIRRDKTGFYETRGPSRVHLNIDISYFTPVS